MLSSHSLPDALIVVALAALLGWYLHLRQQERQRRLEIVHQERLAAMDKGIPLPELPTDPGKSQRDPRDLLIHGVAWIALGMGGAIALRLTVLNVGGLYIWPLTIPLLLLGAGFVLTYLLAYRKR